MMEVDRRTRSSWKVLEGQWGQGGLEGVGRTRDDKSGCNTRRCGPVLTPVLLGIHTTSMQHQNDIKMISASFHTDFILILYWLYSDFILTLQ